MSEESQNEIVAQRRTKLRDLRDQGHNPFANGFATDATAGVVHTTHADHDAAALEDA